MQFFIFFYHFLGKIFGGGCHGNGHAAEGIGYQLFGFVWQHKNPESFIKIHDHACQTWVGGYRELLLTYMCINVIYQNKETPQYEANEETISLIS